MSYDRIARAVMADPWMIRREALDVIVDIVRMRMNGERFTADGISARIGAGPSSRTAEAHGAVAIIPIYGVIIPRANMFSEISGGTSVTSLQAMFRAALNNDRVGSILLDIDSPGGAVAMIPEMATEIREGRGSKPIVAIANTMAASAAYYLGSQADEFVVTPSGQVGSIGVITSHDDESGMWEQMGIDTTLVTAGEYKAELSPLGPLSDDARAYLQGKVNTYFDMFVSDVAKGRGTTDAIVRENYGQGRMLLSAEAKRAGMVDRIESFDQVLTRMAGGGARSRKVKAEADPSTVRAHGSDEEEPGDPDPEEEPEEPTDTPEPEPADDPEAEEDADAAAIAMADRERRMHLAALR